MNLSIVLFLVIYVGGYIFFFGTSFLLNSVKDGEMYTDTTKTYTFENREFKMVEWVYSENQKMMEIMIEVLNLSLDGVDKYNIGIVLKDGTTLKTEQVVATPTLLVIRAYNVPSDFTDISFRLKVDKPDSAKDLRFYNNNVAIERVNEISDKSIDEYYDLKRRQEISEYQNAIEQLTIQIQEIDEKIQNSFNLIDTLNNKKKEQVVQKDIQKTDELIKNAENGIITFENQKKVLENEIAENQQRIEAAQSKIKSERE